MSTIKIRNSFPPKKTNPKLLPQIWYRNVARPYREQIEHGDCDFFVNKDYSSDVASAENSDKIMESINRFREPIKNMGVENQSKVMKYIQNLTKLAELCI